jgi:hypothetical protein
VAPVAATGQIVWPSETETKFPPARRPDLRGVGGWLLFFCISLTVLAPLLMFVRVSASGFALEGIVDLVLAAFGMLVGFMVWTVSPRSFVLLWIYFGITAALLMLGIVSTLTNTEAEPSQEVFYMFRALVSTIIWFLYFKKSDRVQATFGRNM